MVKVGVVKVGVVKVGVVEVVWSRIKTDSQIILWENIHNFCGAVIVH